MSSKASLQFHKGIERRGGYVRSSAASSRWEMSSIPDHFASVSSDGCSMLSFHSLQFPLIHTSRHVLDAAAISQDLLGVNAVRCPISTVTCHLSRLILHLVCDGASKKVKTILTSIVSTNITCARRHKLYCLASLTQRSSTNTQGGHNQIANDLVIAVHLRTREKRRKTIPKHRTSPDAIANIRL